MQTFKGNAYRQTIYKEGECELSKYLQSIFDICKLNLLQFIYLFLNRFTCFILIFEWNSQAAFNNGSKQ